MIKTLIVDDEPLARRGLSDYLARTDFLEEIGQAGNGMEALNFLDGNAVDLLLLDIQMPGLLGTELVETLASPPAVIFTTAHPDFAIEGFALDAVDYLLKPIAFPRFLKAVLRVKERLATPPETVADTVAIAPASAPEKPLFVKVDGRVEKIDPPTILYAESMQNYCRIFTETGDLLPLLPLKELAAALSDDFFFQVHRSYLVNLRKVEAIDGNQVRIGDKLLPVSRTKRDALAQQLVGNRLL